jgi:hypothetical protein
MTAAASIWFTLFENGEPTAIKVTDEVVLDGTQLLAVGPHGAVRHDGANGSVQGVDSAASWELSFEPTDTELRHLPFAWMYGAPIPRTKSTSPYPSMRVSGSLTVGDRVIAVDGWRGMLGHNWGSEHAHRWIWLRGAGFTESPEAWLDVVIGRIKVAGRTTPWIANGAYAPRGPHGPRYRVGGLLRRVTVQERADGCDLHLNGSDVVITARVTAPTSASVGWEYADPSGSTHYVRNCSAAELSLEVRHHGGTTETLHTPYGGVYELGSATVHPGIAIQPYSDG